MPRVLEFHIAAREEFLAAFVRRFPYDLLDALDSDRLYIVAVGHFRRHPRYWAERQNA